jgi:hypothetical protein
VIHSWSRRFGGAAGLAQLVGFAAATAFAGLATVSYSSANDGWQKSVRMEVARSAAVQEQVRAVYGDEAPATFRVIVEERIAVELGRLGSDNRPAVTQRAVGTGMAAALRAAYEKLLPQSLAADPHYRTSAGGADVIARLRTLRQAEIAELRRRGEPVPDPVPSQRSGDAAAVRGVGYAVAAAVISLAVARFALVYYPARHRRPPDPEVADLVEQPRLSPADGRRRVAVVILGLWAVGAVLPLSQLILGGQEQRTQAASARLAAAITTDIAVSNARVAFGTQAKQTAAELGVRARARRDAAEAGTGLEASNQRAVANAEARAANKVMAIAMAMSRPPGPADGLEPRLRQALVSVEKDWHDALAEQHDLTEQASAWGAASNWTAYAIMAVTALGGAAEVHRKRLQVRAAQRGSTESSPSK